MPKKTEVEAAVAQHSPTTITYHGPGKPDVLCSAAEVIARVPTDRASLERQMEIKHSELEFHRAAVVKAQADLDALIQRHNRTK